MDQYRKMQEIGKGAYGRAILVEAKATKEKLVVKEMDMVKLPIESQEACRDEVKLLAQLQHRNVVRYHDSFEEKRKLYIVMEYCDGGDLEAKITPRNPLLPRLTEREIWDYFVQICLALKYIHGKKVLHRDLKPSNIFLTRKGEVKLGDFGVSRTLKYTMELATTFAGTPVYLSPEVVDSKPYNDKSDVWSLGCILFEMATGDLPFDAANILALCNQIMNKPHKRVPIKFSAELRQLVDDLLKKNPSKRPSINEVLQKPTVRTVARRFLSERELSNQPNGPRKSPSPIAAAGAGIAVPVDSLLLYRAKVGQHQPVATPPQRVPVQADPQLPEPLQPVAPNRQDKPTQCTEDTGAMPKPPPIPDRTLKPASPPRVAHVIQPRHFVPLDDEYLRVFDLDRVRKPANEAPKPNRLAKPQIFGIFRKLRGDRPKSPARPAAPPAAPVQPRPASPPSAQQGPERELTLYEELIALGDDFDINNLDLTGEKYFKDEIDEQNQANTADATDSEEDLPPSYDQLESRLQLNPHPVLVPEEDTNGTLTAGAVNPFLDDTFTPGQTKPAEQQKTLTAGDVQALRDELFSLDFIKTDSDSFPDIKLDEDDDGPDNFSHLFSLPPPDVKDKDYSLYDELLAIELHNRERKWAATAPKS